MKMKIISLPLIFTLLLTASSQLSAQINFDNIQHEFGKIHKDSGDVLHRYTFTNQSDDTLYIQGVKVDCSCTSSNWSSKAVPPGGQSFVELIYHPSKPGPFNKGATVHTNIGKQELVFSGLVTDQIIEEHEKVKPSLKIHFAYNKNLVDAQDQRFEFFVNQLALLAKSKQPLKIAIESSASTVPTTSFKNNQYLAQKRLEDNKALLLEMLAKHQIDPENVLFVEEKAIVQGPVYQKDAHKKSQQYSAFQYVIMRVL